MQTLKQHELFEIEVLDILNRAGFLRPLVFGGGTMLRLCHELPRYSVDLDFWFFRDVDTEAFYKRLLVFLKERYQMKDAKNKHYTLLYEFKGPASERNLKLEIRKQRLVQGTEQKIAYSIHGSTQVLLRCFSLKEMAKKKVEAILDRKEIRDYFDLDFLLKRGVALALSKEDKEKIRERLSQFHKTDYSVVLGALLPPDLRAYYLKNGFTTLLEHISKLEPTS